MTAPDPAQRLARIEETLARIEQTLAQLSGDFDGMQVATQRMDHHISFVESVYQQVRRPFHALMDMAERVHRGAFAPATFVGIQTGASRSRHTLT